MATIYESTAKMDVSSKYKELIETALDSEGIYIRTKETLQELFTDKTITATQKAEIITQVMANINGSVVTSAMSTALQWEAKEHELEYRRLELQKQLDVLDSQVKQAEQAAEGERYATALKKAELQKVYGVTVDANGNLIDTVADGRLDKEIQILGQDYLNKQAEETVLKGKTLESHAAVHKVIADTYENYGTFTYTGTVSENGISSITKTSSHDTLAQAQRDIAQQQAKGYTYNAWTNALQGSATMIGTLVASEDYDAVGSGMTSDWTELLTKLKNLTAPTYT